MKRLYIVVEGQTEEEFVRTMLRPYLFSYGIYDVKVGEDSYEIDFSVS